MTMSGRQRSEQRCHILALCWLLVLPFSAAALSLEMKYKPPVQSSVSKLRNSRFSSNNEKHSRTSNRAAASSVATPQDLSNSSPSFEDRMRGLVFGKQNTQPTRKLPPNVCTVENLQEYKNVVGEETSKVVAVRFFASWCKACKAAQPLFYRTAKQFPNVVFVDVPVTDRNSNLHQGLEVPSLPYGHIYHPRCGLVEELRITRKFVPSFARKLQSYVTGSCELQELGETSCPYPMDDGSEE